jgi:hypothetical protein
VVGGDDMMMMVTPPLPHANPTLPLSSSSALFHVQIITILSNNIYVDCCISILEAPREQDGELHSSIRYLGPLYIRAHLEFGPFGVEPTWT